MSDIHTIEGIFEVAYTDKNIEKIVLNGSTMGLVYLVREDDGWQGMPEGTELTPKQVAHKVTSYKGDEEAQEYGPMVNVMFDNRHISMWLHKNDADRTAIHWSGLEPTRVQFADGQEGLNFPYFITKFVDLYGQFNMVSLEASYF